MTKALQEEGTEQFDKELYKTLADLVYGSEDWRKEYRRIERERKKELKKEYDRGWNDGYESCENDRDFHI